MVLAVDTLLVLEKTPFIISCTAGHELLLIAKRMSTENGFTTVEKKKASLWNLKLQELNWERLHNMHMCLET